MKLQNGTQQASLFFKLLPLDWQESLVPNWDFYKNKGAQIWLLSNKDDICAGGILFKAAAPEMDIFKSTAQHWFDLGYLYIAYVWVPVRHRDKGYGSQWIQAVLQQFPKQGFWLTTEEKGLRNFYEKNHFKYLESLQAAEIEEELFVYQP
ncbi:hypothetical protein GCM10011416_15510 [Polaribacter pacificus]|uniref:N-acetyltransferase domain-containing protein n=1 Tax=Polaribacter pacificus TaxID=1775173 RepID=A0A917MDY9_9FLAO|nr:GNAT family N-acetyltransferase [Polaribacter pacificus]GGG98314.1 hypothetical protein GCM10011416_15510 [Polaribacter pacificus]